MLGGNHDIHDTGRLSIDILDGDLALCIRSQPLCRAVFAEARQLAAKTVGEHDRRRHQLGSLIGGVAKHQALITRTLLCCLLSLSLLRIDSLGNVGTLRSDDIIDENPVSVKHIVIILIANLADGIANDFPYIDGRFQCGILEFWNRDFTPDHHDIALGIRLTGDAALRIN